MTRGMYAPEDIEPPPTFSSLEFKIAKHWQTYRPKMSAALRQQGCFQQAVHAAAQLTLQTEAEAIQSGMSPDQAREATREQWAFLPSEEDVPELASDPRTWEAPPLTDEKAVRRDV